MTQRDGSTESTPRITLERMARALCDADGGFPDEPGWVGSVQTYSNGRLTSLAGMLSEWAPAIHPQWAAYVVDARAAAVAAHLMDADEPVDFSDIPQWELVKKEAKDSD